MKKLYLIALSTIFLIITSTSNLKASHFVGADLTYTCLGGATYLITLSFYKDCSGISAPNTAPVVFTCSSNSNFNFTATLQKISGTGQEITLGCSTVPTSCSSNGGVNGVGPYGIQEFVYQATVNLPPCSSWDMHWTSSARNPITTLSSSSPMGWFTPAHLDNLTAPSNSSPTFSNKPVTVVCNNQSFVFNHGAVDPDGDSLVYSFYAPYASSLNTSVQYAPPYSASNFLNSSTPITLNPITGDISFTPNTLLNTVTGIKVEEWRTINGIPTHIGTTYRDIQLLVTTCSNSVPTLSGIDTLISTPYNPTDTNYYMETCLNTIPITFNIYGFDADTADTSITGNPEIFHILWNSGIIGATFMPYYNGTDSAYAQFSWQPTPYDISNTPHCFTASIHDEACPYYGSQTYSYCFLIKGMTVDIGSDTLLCDGESITINADASSGTINYNWSLDGNNLSLPYNQDYYDFSSAISGVGIHTISITTDDSSTTLSCPGQDEIIVDVKPQPNINGTLLDSIFCNTDSVVYDAGPAAIYLWRKNGNLIGNSQTLHITQTGNYTTLVDGGNNTRCTDSDTFDIDIFAMPPSFSLGNDTTINNNQTLILYLPTPYTNYWWNTGNASSTLSIDNSFAWQNTIIGSVYNDSHCKATDTIIVYIDNVGIESTNTNNIEIYPNPVINSLNISLDKNYQNTKYSIYNISGTLIKSGEFEGDYYKISGFKNTLSGYYLLNISNESINSNFRFIKK